MTLAILNSRSNKSDRGSLAAGRADLGGVQDGGSWPSDFGGIKESRHTPLEERAGSQNHR
jgi:hypothetical protein